MRLGSVRERGRLAALAVALVVVAGLGAAALALQPMPLLPEAQASLGAKPDVAFQKAGGDYEWMPPSMHYDVGLVVYPGALVPAAAYGPVAQRIAAHGYLVVVAGMPLNLAVLGSDRAAEIIARHPEVRRWAIAGHSLGGAMAAQFVAAHPGVMRGLALWAAYPGTDVSGSPIACASVYGTLDHAAATIASQTTRQLLPAGCTVTTIEGGNHQQMGSYAGPRDDPPATVSRDDQQGQTAEATLRMLTRVQAQPDAWPPAPAGPSGSPD